MGLAIDVLREDEVVERILHAASTGIGGSVVTPNLDQLRRFVTEPELRALFQQASLVLVDGTTLVWASRLQGTPLPERIPGSKLIFSLSAAAAEAGVPVFLLGGNPGTAARAAVRLQERFPALRVVGTLCPPFGFESVPEQIRSIEAALRSAQPQLVYVCLGFPKQEYLIRQLRSSLPDLWFLGLGVSLSFAAGELVRAPQWVQRIGAEWLHRLIQEPRLFNRFVVKGLPFAVRLFGHAARVRVHRHFEAVS